MSAPAQGNGQAARRPPLLVQIVGPPPTPDRPFCFLRLALGREVNVYFLEPLPSDYGRSFELVKLEKKADDEAATVYHVLLDGRRSGCDCPGHQRYGYCKHLDTIRMLAETGQLHPPVGRPAQHPAGG